MELHTIGIHHGKTVFHLVGLNLRGEVVVRKKFSPQAAKDVEELMEDVIRSIDRVRASPEKLRGCILQSELPVFLR